MGVFRWRRAVMVLLLLSVVLGPLLGPLAAPRGSGGATPLAALLAPPAAHAQVSDGSNFGSAVPCLEAVDQFATSCFVISDATRTPSASDSALYTFNTSGKTVKVTQGQVGSIYGLALDSGSASGTKRLFMGAYGKRLAPYGPLGSGGIYALNLTSGAVTQYTTVPGTTDGHAGTNDTTMGDRVGTTSLGDMEVSPDGKRLYVMNIEQDRLEVLDVSTVNPATKLLGNVALNYNLISTSATVQADLHPMGLEFQPNTNTLYIGVVDGHSRDGGMPRAYVLTLNTDTNTQALVLSQDLGATPIQDRLNGGGTPWYSWNYSGKPWGQTGSRITNHPEPMLADIEFVGTTGKMVLGFRDRMGDMFYSQNPPTGEKSALAQGDVLLYQSNGSGGWTLVAGSGANSADFVNDGYVGSVPSGSHDENLMGALATTTVGTLGSAVTQMVSTAITPVNSESMGANWYQVNPLQTARTAAVELIPPASIGAGKATSLGDLENLCAVAYIGDRVWIDTNGNGIQDSGENGIGGVDLALLDGGGAIVATATTDSSGIYAFAVEPGIAYTIKVRDNNFQSGGALQTYILSPKDRGSDDAVDSDADQIAHTIAVPGQNRDVRNYTFDVGVMTADKANGTVGDFVWNDLNSNGVQDAGESGVSGVTVNLLNSSTGAVVQTTSTSTSGLYQFNTVAPGTYVVQFVPPAGINATTRDAGGNDATDSDADASTGWKTPAFTVIADTFNSTLDLGLITKADVKVVKTAAASVRLGDHLVYTLTYTNNGPAQATAVSVSDTLPAGLTYQSATPAPSSVSGQTLTWNFGTLANGATGSITVDTIVTTAAPASLHNCAAIMTSSPGNDPSDDTSCIDTPVLRANVYVVKTGTASVYIGEAVNYTLAYGNNGNGPAPATVLVDTLPAGLTYQSASPPPSSVSGQTLTWNLGTLAAGATGSISVATVANMNAPADVTNGATISTSDLGDNPGDNTSTTNTHLARANITVAKTGWATAEVGDMMTYAITVTNLGPDAADAIQLTDTLPAGVTFNSSTLPGMTQSGQTLAWTVGRLNAGQTSMVYVQVHIDAAVANSIVNTANVTTPTPGDSSSDNQATWPTTILRPDLAVVKTGPAIARAGKGITYQLLVTNHGQGRAELTSLVDTLPAGITFTSATPATSSVSGQVITWDLGTLPAGATRTITVLGTVDQNAPDQVTNTSTVSTPTPGDPPGDNTSSVTTRIPRPDVMITKTDGVTTAQPGDTLRYSLTVTNTGTITATGVVITETPPVSTTVQATGWTAQPNGTWTTTIGDLAAGAHTTRAFVVVLAKPFTATTVLNTAVVAQDDPDPTPGNNTTTDLDQVQSGTVGDTIWLDKDGNGTQDAGEQGIPFVPVQLLDASGTVLGTTTTDGQGQYLFDGLASGTYTVRIDPDQMTTTPLSQYTLTTPATPGTTLGGSTWIDRSLDIGLRPLMTTAVVLSYFKIDAGDPANVVRWGTLSEQDTDHFRVLRGTSATVARATQIGTVASQGSQGADYRFTDPSAQTGAYYWLVEVERDGHETVYGPVRLRGASTSTDTTTQLFLPLITR